jgi:glycosyltransferase involved in cell wall biosynthesis
MKIGYWLDLRCLNVGGTAPYSWRLLECILNQDKLDTLEILVLCHPEFNTQCNELISKYKVKAKVCLIPNRFNLLNRVVNKFANFVSPILHKYNIYNPRFKYLNSWYRWFSSLNIDLLHVPYQLPPQYNLPYPFIVTMHDVQELHYPEFFTPQDRAFRAEHFWKSIEYSSVTIVSFEHVKKDLIKYFRVSENKVHICPPPYQKIYLHLPTHEEKLNFQEKYANWGKFILYPAQTWEHKNHITLIKAVEYIKEKFALNLHLICTGKKNEVFFPVIEDYLEKSQVADQIHFVDIIPETELYWLYKNCSLVVIPTLYEAGSFPLLEAMSLEVPVICSSVTSLPETIGDLRFTFNPLDIPQMADLILQILNDIEFCTANIINSKNRIKVLKQIDSAHHLINIYKKVLIKENAYRN